MSEIIAAYLYCPLLNAAVNPAIQIGRRLYVCIIFEGTGCLCKKKAANES